MTSFFKKANEQIIKLLKSPEGSLQKAKQTLNDAGVPIPITSQIMIRLLKKQIGDQKQIKEFSLSFEEDAMYVKGVINKLFIDIPFELKVSPVKANQRMLHFYIHYLKPTNAEWIKKRIFHNPPIMSYEQNEFQLDLNQIDKIKVIPIGNVKHFEIKDEKLWVTMGL
ncbi:hypothetical protein [Bacillus sp. CGMCC 1.16541]|uniref:hypothetical protein n=1 Tax=Bacillus sp. CGMCC 1.16541 TaxID=2185143 RepID=UPI000D73CBD3|nr:hypothetical protein [Bacillus sp. CGMCC 1.16541]